LQAALQAPVKQTTLAVVLVLTTVVSAGYYLYVVMLMFMRPRADGALVPERAGGLTRMVLAISVALIIILGFAPDYAVRVTAAGRLRMEIVPTAALPPTLAPTGLPPAGGAQIVNAAAPIR
jgi:NADH-quinone oxidoreductase subunit N